MRTETDLPCYLYNFVFPFIKFDMYRSPPKSKKNEHEKTNVANVDGVIEKIDQLIAARREWEKCLVRYDLLLGTVNMNQLNELTWTPTTCSLGNTQPPSIQL